MLDQTIWNPFVLQHGPRSGRFLQSWEWGEFQRAAGETVRRETFEEDGEIVGVAQWLDRKVPLLGTYAFCPKGPVIRKGEGRLEGLAQAGGKIFLRIEPEGGELLLRAKKSIDLNPANTLITELTHSEDALLAAMHEKTRYNIRVAGKHDLEIDLHHASFDDVWMLFGQTAQRGDFRLHSRSYYELMLRHLQTDGCRAFCAAAHKSGKPLAVAIMVDFGDTRTYLHGASSSEDRNLMAPYLLHWSLLKDAKARGKHFYDWGGVALVGAPSDHPWSGISRFKRGFFGEEVAAPGTFDLVLQPARYRLYAMSRAVVRALRH
ncbi:peptidoglycan bridge formation glycyltransferase FemA/FemB family protein [Candidatus Uhrbacteria bacterium]|nr:peptidoglycan bridge formation glycyltransferase FemA/FemB family protein [Candidatus Uhrbacteria bacterium]